MKLTFICQEKQIQGIAWNKIHTRSGSTNERFSLLNVKDAGSINGNRIV